MGLQPKLPATAAGSSARAPQPRGTRPPLWLLPADLRYCPAGGWTATHAVPDAAIIGRVARRPMRLGRGLVVLALLVLGGASCGGKSAAPPVTPREPVATNRPTAPASTATTSQPATTTTTAQPATTTSTTLAPTTTTASTTTTVRWRPTAPAPTPEQAVVDVVEAWYLHEHAKALTVASPGAVAALFSHPFPPGGVQYRGCSSTPGPRPADYCTYRWSTAEKILELTVTQAGGGWAVTAVSLLR